MIIRSFLLILCLAISMHSKLTYAAVKVEHIRESIKIFMVGHMENISLRYGKSVTTSYKIGALDSRLNMPDCAAPLSVELKSTVSIGRTNVRVSCQHDSPWTIFVPVNINLYRQVVTTLTPLSKGTLITSEHLQLREMPVSSLNGSYYTKVDAIVGMQAKRNLRADTAVIESFLELPILIKRGESVIVSATSGALRVKIQGTALKDGYEGEQIRVRNSQSKRIINALVTGRGRVSVAM
ncbi:MAG: flagella basal body P-ring formation protein FlgA [Gammaproteobacteria bacterium]|jgi:flagella basal body P-ring formation protein FlgA